MTVKVTFSITPHQLQIIDESLRLYAHVNSNLGRKDREHPLEEYRHNILGGDPRKLVLAAREIRQIIGLK